ncbi:monooxygenase [Sphingomonas sp. HMWF008]|nr:monooxygenase [Sphingomonas sp. HMWF008]
MVKSAEVVIAGGGPVGLGLAIELGQRGVRTLVVERHAAPQLVPKGQNLTQRTMEHFHFWGAEAALRAARTIPPSFAIGGITAYGTLLSGLHYDWLQRELVRPYYYTDNERLPQYATEQVLRDRVAELDTVELLTGWSAEDVAQDADGVTLTAVARATGERRDFTADYLVGCDGSRSIVRQHAGIRQTLSDHDRLMVLLVFRSLELDQLLQRFPGKSYYNVLHPDFEGYWQFFGRVDLDSTFFFHAPVPETARDGGFDFAAFLQRAVGAAFDIDLRYTGFWELRFAIADDYRASRVFVAGDAAHSHPPYGGYGINTGFEDARNLGWKLAAVLRGWGGPTLLDSYSAERHAVFASTARDFIAKAIEIDRDFLNRFDPARDSAAFDTEWRIRAGSARSEVRAFEPNYRGSSVVFGADGATSGAVGAHEFRAAAGRHLAPLKLSSGSSSYDLLGPGFTLFAFDVADNVSIAFANAAALLGLPLTIVADTWNCDAARYEARLVLVRPDQFVAWTSNAVDEDDAGAILRRAAGLSA